MDKKEIQELMKRVKRHEKTMKVHIPYAESTGRKADFEVEYVFDFDTELGDVKPSQGMRCDFLYEGDDAKIDGIHMILPELLDREGDIITDKAIIPDKSGKATMWILSSEGRKDIHKKRLKVGVKGRWVVGSKTLARVVVTKIIGLFENK